jgi:hypothetical protein
LLGCFILQLASPHNNYQLAAVGWDHTNDPNPGTLNSFNKPYLNYINNLAQQSPGYQEGFNVILTNDGPYFNEYVYNNPDNLPLWDLGYTGGVYNNQAYSGLYILTIIDDSGYTLFQSKLVILN